MLPFTIEQFIAAFAAGKAVMRPSFVAQDGVAREHRIEFTRHRAVLAAAGATRIQPAR